MFHGLFKVRGGQNKGQLLKGGVVEKRLKTTVLEGTQIKATFVAV